MMLCVRNTSVLKVACGILCRAGTASRYIYGDRYAHGIVRKRTNDGEGATAAPVETATVRTACVSALPGSTPGLLN